MKFIFPVLLLLLSCAPERIVQVVPQPIEIAHYVDRQVPTAVLPEKLGWPLEGPVIITSPFGRRSDLRKTATGGGDSLHEGVDLIPADRSKAHAVLHAMGDGKVVTIFGPRHPHKVYGICVMVRHDLGLQWPDGSPLYVYTLLAHLSEVWVGMGDVVVKGDPVGRMGSSGEAEGFHVHVEVLVNPSDFLEAPETSK